MIQKYCIRCKKDITYRDYLYFCKDCNIKMYRRFGKVPNYIPDEQVEKYRRLKNV